MKRTKKYQTFNKPDSRIGFDQTNDCLTNWRNIMNILKSRMWLTIVVTLISLNVSQAQDCVDDATGAYAGFGGCTAVINNMGQGCGDFFVSTTVWQECPVTCGTCPPEEDGCGNAALAGD